MRCSSVWGALGGKSAAAETAAAAAGVAAASAVSAAVQDVWCSRTTQFTANSLICGILHALCSARRKHIMYLTAEQTRLEVAFDVYSKSQ